LVYDLTADATTEVNDDGVAANEDYYLVNNDVDIILKDNTTFVVRADTNDAL
jgi:hypothetical protein